MSAFQNYVHVESVRDFPSSGYIAVGDEVISYNNRTDSYPYRLQGCVRGRFGTQPISHKKNTRVRLIQEEGLFPHITQTSLTKEDKIDYKCVCLKNVKDIETGDISMYFSMLPPSYSKERISLSLDENFSKKNVALRKQSSLKISRKGKRAKDLLKISLTLVSSLTLMESTDSCTLQT